MIVFVIWPRLRRRGIALGSGGEAGVAAMRDMNMTQTTARPEAPAPTAQASPSVSCSNGTNGIKPKPQPAFPQMYTTHSAPSSAKPANRAEACLAPLLPSSWKGGGKGPHFPPSHRAPRQRMTCFGTRSLR